MVAEVGPKYLSHRPFFRGDLRLPKSPLSSLALSQKPPNPPNSCLATGFQLLTEPTLVHDEGVRVATALQVQDVGQSEAETALRHQRAPLRLLLRLMAKVQRGVPGRAEDASAHRVLRNLFRFGRRNFGQGQQHGQEQIRRVQTTKVRQGELEKVHVSDERRSVAKWELVDGGRRARVECPSPVDECLPLKVGRDYHGRDAMRRYVPGTN